MTRDINFALVKKVFKLFEYYETFRAATICAKCFSPMLANWDSSTDFLIRNRSQRSQRHRMQFLHRSSFELYCLVLGKLLEPVIDAYISVWPTKPFSRAHSGSLLVVFETFLSFQVVFEKNEVQNIKSFGEPGSCN